MVGPNFLRMAARLKCAPSTPLILGVRGEMKRRRVKEKQQGPQRPSRRGGAGAGIAPRAAPPSAAAFRTGPTPARRSPPLPSPPSAPGRAPPPAALPRVTCPAAASPGRGPQSVWRAPALHYPSRGCAATSPSQAPAGRQRKFPPWATQGSGCLGHHTCSATSPLVLSSPAPCRYLPGLVTGGGGEPHSAPLTHSPTVFHSLAFSHSSPLKCLLWKEAQFL